MHNENMKINIKLIRISENAHKNLKVKAAQSGVSIKKLIELLSSKEAEDIKC